MNRMIKKIAAALVALACVPVTGLTASAETEGYDFGTISWQAVAGLQQFKVTENRISYVREYIGNGPGELISVTPRQDTLRFVMRDGVDMNAIDDEVVSVVETYIPNIRENTESRYGISHSCAAAKHSQVATRFMGERRAYDLELLEDLENRDEIEAGILLGLARKHLITEFYGWGKTAAYIKPLPD